jgi:hypothetical protein
MKNIKITAKLSTPIGVGDDWSPDLPSLLERLWFQSSGSGEASSDPRELRHAPIPLEMRVLGRGLTSVGCPEIMHPTQRSALPDNWYWACSAPCYEIISSGSMQVRKRQDPNTTGCINNRSHKWDSSTGQLKNYDLPILHRTTAEINWFAVGDADRVLELLATCHALGKKTAAGLGQVEEWLVEEVEKNYSLTGPDDELMRVVPVGLLSAESIGYSVRNWAWRPCPKDQLMHWRELCALPTKTVKYANTKTNALAMGAATAV